ncbi:MAG: polyphosphate kinase 2 family protein [Acidobacteriota bacterium]
MGISRDRLDKLHRHFLVKPGSKLKLKNIDPAWAGGDQIPKKVAREVAAAELTDDISDLAKAQELLYADRSRALLVIFQALDAAGKDGTIKHVMTGLNPQGVRVNSFKVPSMDELGHTFLWRYTHHLPERGMIGIFNRSYYEEVLVVRVHPEYLAPQKLPAKKFDGHFWRDRYEDINAYERHLVRNGTEIVKFFLHISKDEQKRRFLDRIENPEKNWKFSSADLKERRLWDQYQEAFEDAITATSTKEAPWHVIPADNKWMLRALVASILAAKIQSLKLRFPVLPQAEMDKLGEAKAELQKDN